MKGYVSLIMDIEKSREYKVDERNEIQKYMVDCIKKLNKLFASGLECEIIFSAGDELQGLFTDLTMAVMYFRILEILLHPVKIRGGIGVGEWNVKILNGLSTQQDGPAYHRAREAIREVKKKQLQNIRICSGDDDVMCNHLMNAAHLMKNQQAYRQNRVLAVLELLYPFAKGSMWTEKSEIIQQILQMKFEYEIGQGKKLEAKLNFSDHLEIHSIIIDGDMKDAEEHIVKKNMAETVAQMLRCTRQNAASIIKSGNSNKIRELDYMALQYIDRKYGDREWNY